MTMMGSNNNKNNNINGSSSQFGDTTLTKVFVGGLAWETPKDALREHFQKYGDILEAVIISDKITGRSKGYGFVTFKEAEAANKACQEPSFIINGRRVNCNLASFGARRPTRSSSPSTSPPPPPTPSQVQWYYSTPTPPASPFHHHVLPFYGYTTPTYIATTDHMNYNYNYNYNQKLSYGNSGGYVNNYVYPRQGGIVGVNTLMPMIYPYYHPAVYPNFHRTQAMGVPAPHFFHPTHYAPASITPAAVGTGECLIKRVV